MKVTVRRRTTELMTAHDVSATSKCVVRRHSGAQIHGIAKKMNLRRARGVGRNSAHRTLVQIDRNVRAFGRNQLRLTASLEERIDAHHDDAFAMVPAIQS
jgi:hypothetical protein